MTTSPNFLHHLAALTTALAIAAGCSSAEHPAAPSLPTAVTEHTAAPAPGPPQAVTTTVAPPTTTPTTTAVPVTTVVPTTTVPETTTTTAVPVPSTLAPDQQPETVEEGRQLIASTSTTALSPPFQSYPAMIDSALYAVLEGTIPSAEFFDAIGLQIPDGVVVSPYLVCPIALGEKCRADPTDYARFMAECAGPATEVFTNLVEIEGSWAAAGTCVWVPDQAQLEAAEDEALSFVIESLRPYVSVVVRAPTIDPIAVTMAQAWASADRIGDDDQSEFTERSRALLQFGDRTSWWATSQYLPSQVMDEEYREEFRASLVDDAWIVGLRTVVGVGSVVHHGIQRIVVVYAG